MKKLSQTWRQKRPRNTCHSSNNVRRKSGTKDTPEEEENDFDLMPSLGASFDWKIEEIVTVSQLKTSKGTATSKKHDSKCKLDSFKSPSINSVHLLNNRQISTPSDLAKDTCADIFNGMISPVGTVNTKTKAFTVQDGSLLFFNEKGKERELAIKQDNYLSRLDASTKSAPGLGCNSQSGSKPSQHSLKIDSWGLPECVVNQYIANGIVNIFEWQRECLLTGKALNGGNLVYSAPTSAGKTLVAEVLMLKRVLKTKRKAIYVLPFVSVAREKMFYLQDMFRAAGIRVDGYMGAQAPSKGFIGTDIAICTIEKANSLVNRLMEERKMSSLGMVVIDEMHMIGDGHRGYLLELMLSKIRFLQKSSASDDTTEDSGVQIVGMSATLPNLKMLADWLNADLYLTEYRPVPLVETIKVGKVIMDQDQRTISEINESDIVRGDEDHIVPLCLETIRNCHSVLIFCPTKQWCERLAKNIADNLKHLIMPDPKQGELQSVDDSRTALLDTVAIAEVIEQLKRSPAGLDKVVADVVSSGVSFHHAGLTFDERDIIEGAFKRGAVRVLVATSTLSSGVNLPARRVILRTPIFHGKVINSLVYKQMTGRAGRKGVDTTGESILICKPSEKQKGIKLLRSHLDPVYSCLIGTDNESEVPGMKRALLEIIAAGVATTRNDAETYAKSTYLNFCLASLSGRDPAKAIKNTISFLIENEFIRIDKGPNLDIQLEDETEQKFAPTQLGLATLASALSPDEALVVFKELQKARRCFVLENELHIVYQVMPIYMQSQWPELDWYRYFSIYEKLPPQYKRVGEIVGVEEAFLASAVRGRVPTRSEAQRQKLAVHQRFYSALVLLELVNEIPLRTVSRRYNVSKGLLQSLQNSASTFAGMVTKFCQKLGWRNLEMLVDQFQSRLSFGVTRELCDLVRISSLNGARARLLYNAGYHTVGALAVSSPNELRKLLENFAPFESDKKLQGESGWEVASKKRLRNFWVTGRSGMTEAEAAELIVYEAKELVQGDLAAMGVQMNDVQFQANQFTRHVHKQTEDQSNRGGVSTSAVKHNNDNKSEQHPSTNGLVSMQSDQVPIPEVNCSEKGSSLSQNQKRHLAVNDGNTAENGDRIARGNVTEAAVQTVATGKRSDLRKILDQMNEDLEQRDASKAEAPKDTAPPRVAVKRVNTSDNKENISPQDTKASNEPSSPEVYNEASNRKRSFNDISHDSKNQEYFQITSSLNAQDFDACISGLKEADGNSGKKITKNDCMTANTEEKCWFAQQEVSPLQVERPPDRTAENSLEEANGSFILINSREEEHVGFDFEGSKKDTSMELFSQPQFDDVETHTPSSFNECRSITKFTKISDYVFDNQTENVDGAAAVLSEKGNLCRQDKGLENSNIERINEQVCKVVDNFQPVRRKSSNISFDGSTSSILFDSFGTCNLLSPGNDNDHNEQSFCLKLSESFADEGEAFQEATDDRTNIPFSSKQNTDRSGIINNDKPDAVDFLDDENDKVEIKAKCRFDKGIDGDAEIVMSGSDSFTKVLCEIGLNDPVKKQLKVTDEAELNQASKHLDGNKRRSSERIAKRRLSNDDSFRIVDVVVKRDMFDLLIERFRSTKIFSFSVARGSKLDTNKNEKQAFENDIAGLSVCFGGKTSFFVDFLELQDGIGWNSKGNEDIARKAIVELTRDSELVKKVVFDAKEHFKVFIKSFGCEMKGKIYDPKIAAWLLDPSSKEPTFHELALRYLPEDYKDIIHRVGSTYDTGSIGLISDTSASPRLRTSVEAVTIYRLMEILEMRIVSEGLYSSFLQIEMPVAHTVAKMELNGFGFSPERCDALKHKLLKRLHDLETKAKIITRRSFSINNPEEVAQVLFIELGLPPGGDAEVLVAQKRGLGGKRSRTRHLSTAKGVLEKLKHLHPLPSVILEWRKVNKALTSVVYPMQHLKEYCQSSTMFRIHSCYQLHTVTGRMIATEPCIQNVPKDFDIVQDGEDDAKEDIHQETYSMCRPVRKCTRLSFGEGGRPNEGAKHDISMRTTFVPAEGGILVSADYSQLELRIIAHLSRDQRLLSILNSECDVFRMIAAEINQCLIKEVNDQQRQSAKHICYGIIYGIGPKALAEKLHVNEDMASTFMEQFKCRFLGIREFTKRTVDFAKARGYVLTMSGRKRYFSTINSRNAQSRSLAERQAVNTAIQGSAADLVKKAMIQIDKRISAEFSEKTNTYNCPNDANVPDAARGSANDSRNMNANWLCKPKLILQLHDELIYECSVLEHKLFTSVLKTEMEQALKLAVRLPVKVRTGSSWGELLEYM